MRRAVARRRLVRFLPALVLGALILAAYLLARGWPREEEGVPTPNGLHVAGRWLVDGSGQSVQLRGVNRSGTEYACIQGQGIFDGPTDAAATAAIVAWRANVVRVPLNEDCWLGINGVPEQYAGANYQAAVGRYVDVLNGAGLFVILDLHWSAPGAEQASAQQPMPDRDHAVEFWRQVARTFKGNGRVLFDLFNEPHPNLAPDPSAAWTCWRDGGACPGVPYQAAGMQELVTAIRDEGANNVLLLGGLDHANDLALWLQYKPRDPAHNLAAAWHAYNFNDCSAKECYDLRVAPVARKVPVIAGEIGERGCVHAFIDALMPWLDDHGVGYLGWTWNTWECSDGPALIKDYAGTPTEFGQGLKDHLAALPPAAGPLDATGRSSHQRLVRAATGGGRIALGRSRQSGLDPTARPRPGPAGRVPGTARAARDTGGLSVVRSRVGPRVPPRRRAAALAARQEAHGRAEPHRRVARAGRGNRGPAARVRPGHPARARTVRKYDLRLMCPPAA
jgi:endoglucanase